MSWAFPAAFWLLLVLPLAWLARRGWNARLRRAAAGTGAGLPTSTAGTGLALAGEVLASLGLLALVIALAGPRWGAREEVRRSTGADVLVLIDCSRSMQAKDLHPDRMEAARRKAVHLLDLAPDLRLALMPFAATPVLRCPLTGDRAALEAMLNDCSPDLFPADAGLQGTAMGQAVLTGLEILGRQVERGQAILILSDGDDPDEERVAKAAQAAKDAGVPVFGLLVADPDAKPVVAIDGRDEVMTASRATLDRLATATGGAAANATTGDDDLKALLAAIDARVAKRDWEERRRVVASERYQHPLAAGVLLLSLGFLLRTRRWS